jgi:hypothetical protein
MSFEFKFKSSSQINCGELLHSLAQLRDFSGPNLASQLICARVQNKTRAVVKKESDYLIDLR